MAIGLPAGPQAVILASGTGARLYPLNGSGSPKALLPVGNRPLLSYPLAMIEASGVHHVIIVSEPLLACLSRCSKPMLETSGAHFIIIVIRLLSLSPSHYRS